LALVVVVVVVVIAGNAKCYLSKAPVVLFSLPTLSVFVGFVSHDLLPLLSGRNRYIFALHANKTLTARIVFAK